MLHEAEVFPPVHEQNVTGLVSGCYPLMVRLGVVGQYGAACCPDRQREIGTVKYDASLHVEKERLQRQYHVDFNAKRDNRWTYTSKPRPSDNEGPKRTGSRILLKSLSVISVLLLVSVVAATILFLYSVRNYDIPLSENDTSQFIIDQRGTSATPFKPGNSPSAGKSPSR